MLKAPITGCTVQDGFHLREYLLAKGHDVHGSSFNNDRLDHIYQDFREARNS